MSNSLRLSLHADAAKHSISRHLYGHFAEHLGRCIYDGLWVGTDSPIPNTRGWRNDLIDALKKIGIPNLRWPGGCFADTYNWFDGIGPKESRPSMLNVHWGGTLENNHVGTHEFLDLCELLETEPYIAGNVGSGTPREMAQWLEYITMAGKSPMADLRRKNGREHPWNIRFWGVGNENWGCGGNMRPQYYADLYRQFGTYCRHFGGGTLYKVACGLQDEWNEVILRDCAGHMDGLSLHHYSVIVPWGQPKGSATEFTPDEYMRTLEAAYQIEPFIKRTRGMMDRYDPAGRIGIVMDEWGTWWDVEPGTNPGWLYQQNTMRDALVAGLTLNIMNSHCDRVHVANIAQTINVLQAMALTEGAKMHLTPTYHIFEMYKGHHDATLIPLTLDEKKFEANGKRVDQVTASASRAKDGSLLVTLSNVHPDESIELSGIVHGHPIGAATARLLQGKSIASHNTFDAPAAVVPQPFDGVSIAKDGRFIIKLPPASVVAIVFTGRV